MKRKGFLIGLVAFLAIVSQAQTGTFDKINARSSIKLKDITITEISTDTSLSSESDVKLPTERAVKRYIDILPTIKKAGGGISKVADSIYFGGDFMTGFNYNVVQLNRWGTYDYLTYWQTDPNFFKAGHGLKYITVDDNGIYMNGGSAQQFYTAGTIKVNLDGVGLGHSDSYYNQRIDFQLDVDGNITLGNYYLQNGDANNQYLTTDTDGKVILKNVTAPVTPFQTLQLSPTTSWDLNNGNKATLTLTDNTDLSIENGVAGGEGILLVNVTAAGSLINFPGRSYQLKADATDDSSGRVTDKTKVGVIAGTNSTGRWLCKFIYDGTNYYWDIRRAVIISPDH